MKYCSKCGTPAEDNQNFCLNCGSRLTAPIAQAAAETAQNAAAAAATVQDQFAAQQQQTAAAAQNVQAQLAETQAAAAAQAAQVAQQQAAAQEAAAQVAATAEAQQAAAEAAAQMRSEAEAQAKAAQQAAAQQAVQQAEELKAAAQQPVQPETIAAAAVPGQAPAQAPAQAAPVAQAAAPVAQAAAQQAAPADGAPKKKSGVGKWLAIIGFALVAIVLVIILLLNVFGSSYQTPIKKMVSAMNSKSTDIDDYMAMYPKMFSTFYKDSMKTTKEGLKLIGKEDLAVMLDQMDFAASMSAVYDDYEKVVGKNVKFSYAIQEKKELDAATLASIAGKYKSLATNLKSQADSVESKTKSVITNAGAKNKDAIDYCDNVKAVIEKAAADIAAIDASAITAGYDVKIRLTIKGDKDEDRDEATYRVLKINGKWVFDATYSSSMFDTDFINEMLKMMMLRSF